MKPKRIIALGALSLLLLCIVLYLISHTTLPIKVLGIFLHVRRGIEVDARGFSIGPGLRGSIEGLYVSAEDGVSARAGVGRIAFDGALGKGLLSEITDMRIENPDVAVKVKTAPAGTPQTPQSDTASKDLYTDLLKKIPLIKKMVINGGRFSFMLSGGMGSIELTGVRVDVKGVGPRTEGRCLVSGDLTVESPQLLRPASGQVEISLDLGPLSLPLSGKGRFYLSLPHVDAKGILLKEVHVDAPISIKANLLTLSPLSIRIKGVDAGDNALPAMRDVEVIANVSYDMTKKALFVTGFKAESPDMGVLGGEMDMQFTEGLPWRCSLHGKGLLLNGIPDILSPFLKPEQRGWVFNGKGQLNVKMEGGRDAEGWGMRGSVLLEIKGGGFNSPDGTKAGEGIDASVEIDISYPQKPGQRGDFTARGKIEGGEYLWGALYRNLSGHSLSWAMDGFFLPIHRAWT